LSCAVRRYSAVFDRFAHAQMRSRAVRGAGFCYIRMHRSAAAADSSGRQRRQFVMPQARAIRMPEIKSLFEPAIALLQIMLINLALSGDNAVVIALACRKLSPAHRRQAFVWGSAGVVILMVTLTVFVVFLLSLPYLQLAGGVLLLWIGVKLFVAEPEGGTRVEETATLGAAIRTIVVADMVMSLENVLAMAGAAKGHWWMLVVGLVITVPIILFGSALLMKLMDKFPVVIVVGAALIGWVAGQTLIADPVLRDWVAANAPYMYTLVPVSCAVLVIVGGKILERAA
jgi:YjbE family integral membrane protein